MNTKELGRWRKLWTRPSPSWEMLPVGARGLGDELLRYCDDQGRVPLMGLEPWQAVARIVRAHVSERRWLQSMLDRLIADGFVRVDGDALAIRNFATAQSAVTDSGERMREMRARDAAAKHVDVAATDERLANDRRATGGRLADDWRTTGGRLDSRVTPQKDSCEPVTVTPSEKRSEKISPLTPLSWGELPSAAESRCPTVEPSRPAPAPLPRLDRDEAAETLRAASGGRIETRAPAASWRAFLGLCAEAGYQLSDLASIGRYVAAGVPWLRSPRVSVGYLAGGRTPGSILEQLVSEAAERDRVLRSTPQPRAVPGAARSDAEAAEAARLLADGAGSRGRGALAKAVGE